MIFDQVFLVRKPLLQSEHLACVFGNPIEQSKSPIIHNLFAKQFNISLNYQKKLVAVNSFAQAAEIFFNNPHAIGANVTMPFKHDALAWVDELSQQAQRAGAVNTIIRTSNGFRGDNTDGIGLVNDLRQHGVELKKAKILVIGAGGAAKGALPALVDAGASQIFIQNRDQAKAKQLKLDVNSFSPGVANLYLADDKVFDLIINATSLSLTEQLPSLSDSIFECQPAVYDMVYKDQPTVFLKHAKNVGCIKTIDGLGMLIEQAAHSFYLWFGYQPDTGPVFKYLRNES
ncbi:MAG TPA: shikimate dehydrogenase [Shewanella frigidimarina]|nr:shikimate dehydrogenase [Shewanella frigidimarina]